MSLGTPVRKILGKISKNFRENSTSRNALKFRSKYARKINVFEGISPNNSRKKHSSELDNKPATHRLERSAC
jgi:hypothetical protein